MSALSWLHKFDKRPGEAGGLSFTIQGPTDHRGIRVLWVLLDTAWKKATATPDGERLGVKPSLVLAEALRWLNAGLE
jgi:hypothetical protein